MAYDYKVLEIKRIPLDDILIGKGLIRIRNIARGISELAESIRVMGQLQPIIVCESADQPGKFEIVSGQRRFLACKELGKDDILAMILDHPITEAEAKVISFTESLTHQPLDKADLIGLCTYLYSLYGDIETVAQKSGLPPTKVREYVKYASLSPELKEMVEKGSGSGGVDLKTALMVQTALEKTGEFKPDVAVALAKKMQGMIGAQQKRVVKEVKRRGVTTVEEVDEVAETVNKGKTYIELRVRLDQEHNKALAKYALEKGVKREDVFQSLVTDALESMAYLESEE